MEPLSRDEVGLVLEPIARDLERIELILVEASRASTGFLSEAALHLTQAGGKRLRPALVVLGSLLGSGPDRAVDLTAAAIEMTHMATLYHDDVIDDADLRRGVPSVNEKWGNIVAILAGDYLFARSSSLAAEVGGEVPQILADAIAEVVRGQVKELETAYDANRDEDHYFSTIRGKTASLIEASTRLGATLGGCGEATIRALAEFGSSFGYAFQIADDLLDLTASKEDLGKPPGTDLRDGVYTLPVILAIQEDDSLAKRLSPTPDLDEILPIVFSTGAFDKSLQIALKFVEQALSALGSAPEGQARNALARLTRLVVERVPTPR